MLIDRKHVGWAAGTAAAAAAAVGVYVLDAPRHLSGPNGSTAVGLTLGGVALGVMAFCAGLGLKRRVPHWPLGRAQTWMRGHLWLGLLVVLLVALHAGWRWGGPMTAALWILLITVTVSGIVGLVLQQVIPNAITQRVRGETVAQQVDRELAGLASLAEDLLFVLDGGPDPALRSRLKFVAPAWADTDAQGDHDPLADLQVRVLDLREKRQPGSKGRSQIERFSPCFEQGVAPLRQFHDEHLAGYLSGSAASPLHDATVAAASFDELRRSLPPAATPGADALEALCTRRRELLTQRRLQRWLHAWLIVHVPLSWLLLVLSAVHAVVALRYGS